MRKQIQWKEYEQLARIQYQLQRAINTCKDGETVAVDYKTALNLIDVIEQAKRTEESRKSDLFKTKEKSNDF